jgi:DNA-binding beta-propeller fold protein YncE
MICRSFMLRHIATAVLVFMGAITAAHAQRVTALETATPTAALSIEDIIRRDIARGVYEVIYSPVNQSVYVASSEAIAGVEGGVVYKLDPQTLEVTGKTDTDKKDFGLAINPSGDTLYVGHSLQSSISAIDIKTGAVKAQLKFTETAADGTAYGPRQIVYQQQGDLLYVGGVGQPGVVWVVDAKGLKLIKTIASMGKWVTGLLVDPQAQRLYVANGDGEIIVVDGQTHTVLHRWQPADREKALLLNLALDAKTKRLFVTDHSKLKTVLVLNTDTGQVIKRLPVGESMAIKLNPTRNELYISHRDRGTVSVLDANTYREIKNYALPQHPNSLALDPTGQVLYVTIKAAFNKDRPASGPESVARIDLSRIKK